METKILLAFIIALTAGTTSGQSRPEKSDYAISSNNDGAIRYKTVKVDQLDIFYREAGLTSQPTILFLHGFPSSSHMYRDILVDLSSKYHVVAPDYPGFGLSSSPDVRNFQYTFDNLSITMEHFIEALGLVDISLYVQDYGGPIGFRLAARRPELIHALIIQNANAHTEGLGDAIAPMKNYFNNPNEVTEKGAREILNTTKWQYMDGVADSSKINPDSYMMDQFYLDRPGNDQIQLALFRDYKSNLSRYQEWQSYFREKQPAALVIWGANDKIFIKPGAEAYRRDLKNIEVHIFDGGHFLLEEYHKEVARLIDSFFAKNK